MKLLSSNQVISSVSNRLAETANYIIVNSQPNTKDTNIPVPYNTLVLDRSQNTAIGRGQMPFYAGTDTTANSMVAPVKRINNSCIDNNNPKITYMLPSARNELNPYYRIYKVTENDDGTLSREFIDISYNTVVVSTSKACDCICNYVTQNDDYVFFVVVSTPLTGSISYNYISDTYFTYVIRLNKTDLTYTATSVGYTNISSGSSSLAIWNHRGVQVLAENDGGIMIYSKVNMSNSSTAGVGYQQEIFYYSFDTATVTNVTRTGDTLPTFNSAATWATSRVRFPIPTEPYDTGTTFESYLVESSTMSSTSVIDTMYKLVVDKTDLTKITISRITMDFGDSSISTLPISTSAFSSQSTSYGNTLHINGVHDGFSAIYEGVKYLHIFFKTISVDENAGIYTFEISSDGTTATFKSFYQAPGLILREWNLLNDNRDQILMSTNSLYQIMRFNTSTLVWEPTFVQNDVATNIILTNNNKMWVMTTDGSILDHNLTGAVDVDFTFEKTPYTVDDTGTDSFINIWAYDADKNYVAQDVRLTVILGNIVFKANGAKTLDTTTSDTGVLTVPFEIQGDASITIGIDALSS